MSLDIDRRWLGRNSTRSARSPRSPRRRSRASSSAKPICARASSSKDSAREAGLQSAKTPSGNTFARWRGSEPDLPAVGDRFAHRRHPERRPLRRHGRRARRAGGDPRAAARAGFGPRRSIELIVFTSEEPTRFGIGCLGSRLMSGTLDASAGATLRDRDGQTLNEVRAAAGFRGSLAERASAGRLLLARSWSCTSNRDRCSSSRACRSRRGHRDRRAGERCGCAGRRGRTCRRGPDAGSPRRISGGRGNRAGCGARGAGDRRRAIRWRPLGFAAFFRARSTAFRAACSSRSIFAISTGTRRDAVLRAGRRRSRRRSARAPRRASPNGNC